MKTVFKSSFLKSIEKIENDKLKSQVAETILEVEKASTLHEVGRMIKMKGYADCYRIRIGSYRIGLKVENETVYFAAFAHRKDIYKIFP
jgi:mRNA interferase RelE/StbE